MRVFRPLDRYVFSEFWKIFVVTALGFPILLCVIDLTDHLESYLNRQVPPGSIALSYLFWIPDSMFMVLPAAVLFATVFSIGAFTRHAELTAAKASGISFYRMISPILPGALLAFGLGRGLGKIVPGTNQKRSQLLFEDRAQVGNNRYNFAFAGEYGRVYKAYELRTDSGRMRSLQIERKGSGPTYPTYLLSADSAVYDRKTGKWILMHGAMNIVSDTSHMLNVTFERGGERRFTERPAEMMAKQRDPHDLTYDELARFINSLERSGGDANLLRVERALKIAIPATCLIIALFGAPLATSTQRGGSAYGIAVSLATTMIFLLMIQLTRAIGGKGIITPDFAAWIPNVVFGGIGLVLMKRVRT